MKRFFVLSFLTICILLTFGCDNGDIEPNSSLVPDDIKSKAESKSPSEGGSDSSLFMSHDGSEDITSIVSVDGADVSDPSIGESSVDSEDSSEISVFVPEEKYLFMTSKYYVTTKTQLHGITYIYKYYLVKGRVAGAVHTVTLLNTQAAKDYHKSIIKKFPDSQRKGASVTVYLEGDDLTYDGFSYEKLKFTLEKSDVRYVLGFDEEDYLERYGGVIVD